MNNPRWIVKAVQPLPDYRLLIPFEKGEKRVFDFKPYLKYKINEPLKNPAFFEKAYADGTTNIPDRNLAEYNEVLVLVH